MEDWQRIYLDTINHSLEKETTCDELLLQHLISDGALADIEYETVRCQSLPSLKARTLYEILKTKTNGYVAMVKALFECNQSEAHKILVQGYAYCLSRKTPISFLGKTKQLSEYFDDDEIDEVISEARGKLLEDQYQNIHENLKISADGITLVSSNAEPPLSSFYIPRKLFKRVVINKRLFQTESSDMFVFKGFQTLCQLDALLYPQEASLSSSYLAHDAKVSRFLLLENDDHWERILKDTNVYTHLVKYEEETNTFALEKTTGWSKILGQHMERPHRSVEVENAYHQVLSEKDFVDGLLNGSVSGPGICICDSPGMGKTLLLGNVAHEIAKRCPDRLVAFISLSHLIQHLTHVGIPPHVDSAYIQDAILEYLSTSPVSFCVLKRILSKFKVSIELFFDGFDEVSSKHMAFTKKLLMECVTNFPNARVIVTSRPHMRHELESSLQVTAFDMTAFTKSNQLEFLVTVWGKGSSDYDNARLEKFARYCMENLHCTITKEEQTITGIPLLCRLISQVYSRNAKLFARSSKNTLGDIRTACNFETSLPKLYTNFVAEAFERLSNEPEATLKIKQYHIWMAFQTVFPEFAQVFYREFSVSTSQSIVDSSISLGILQRRATTGKDQNVEFVHRTFPEYFVSEFFAEAIKKFHVTSNFSEEFKKEHVRFLLEVVLMTKDIGDKDDVEGFIFTNPVVVYFLNHYTHDVQFPFKLDILTENFSLSVSPSRLYSLLFGCLRENYANLFLLFKYILSSVNDKTLKKFKSEMIPDGDPQLAVRLINVASVFSSIPLVDTLFTLFQESFSYDLPSVCKEMPLHLDTPLHFAIESANVEKIQYFAKIMSLKDRKLLLSFVIKSNEDGPQAVNRKIAMIRLLLSMDKDILSEASYTLYDSVHVEILKALLEEGADPTDSKTEENLIHRAATYMSTDNFHELCRFLIEDMKAAYIFKPNEPKWKSPLMSILRRQRNVSHVTIKMILGVPGIDVNEKCDHKRTLFLTAVTEKFNNDMLEMLTKAGADINAINIYTQNALQLAAQAGNARVIPFLINLGVDVAHCDAVGNTFLHYFGTEGTTPEEYHHITSMLSSKGSSDIFHIKNAEGQLPVQLAVRKVEIKQETLEIFKSHKVNFNSVDNKGWSLLMYAARAVRSVDFLKSLIEMGVDIMTRDSEGRTFTHIISKYYSAQEFHNLLTHLICNGHKQAFMAADSLGRNPVHWAIISTELLPETLDFICTNLAETVKATDNSNQSLLVYAARGMRSVSFVKALLNMGVDPMIQNKDGNSFAHIIPEFYSASELHEIMELLIDAGFARIFQVVNSCGETPFHLAVAQLVLLPKTLHLIGEKLVETGIVDINITDNLGISMLMYTVVCNAPSVNNSIHSPITRVKWDKEQSCFLMHRSTGNRSDVPQAKWSVEHLKILIEMGADPMNQDGTFKDTFLHYVSGFYSADQYHEIVEVLVKTGHERAFQVVNVRGESPLHVAVVELELLDGTLDLVNSTLFQTNIVDINATDAKGHSLVAQAAIGGRTVKFLEKIMSMGADPNIQNEGGNTFVHLMALSCTPCEFHGIVELLIRTGPESILQMKNNNGRSPIHLSVYKMELSLETLDLIAVCCNRSSDKDIQDSTGQTTCSNGLNAVDKDGNSVLHLALTGERSFQFVKRLVTLGANWSVKNNHNSNLAHTCASYGLIEHLKYFVELGCDIHALDADGDSVLHGAVADAAENVYEIVTFLLEKGANKFHKNNKEKQQTAYEYAVDKGITDERILDALK